MIDEKSRLDAVSRFGKLEPNVAADLKNIVDLAAQICNTPVALVTLLDEHVQWFKATKGIDMESTDRSIAFCNYTIQQDGLLVVPDTLSDLRFTANPLVAEAPHVRFYAGATLTTKDGHNIGSLCVIDMEERDLNEMQRNALKTLSKQVMRLMEMNWTMRMLEEHHAETERQKILIEASELKLRAVFDSSKDTHMLIDSKLELLAFNKAADHFFIKQGGIPLRTGAHISEFVSPETLESLETSFKKAFKGETHKVEWCLRSDENEIWHEVEFTPISSLRDGVIGVAVNSSDITDRKLQEDHINIQNAALTRIAIIQSHELRRPVASILGITALLKLEQGEADNNYLEMLDFTVKELDRKICGIVKDSEDTINNYLSIVT